MWSLSGGIFELLLQIVVREGPRNQDTPLCCPLVLSQHSGSRVKALEAKVATLIEERESATQTVRDAIHAVKAALEELRLKVQGTTVTLFSEDSSRQAGLKEVRTAQELSILAAFLAGAWWREPCLQESHIRSTTIGLLALCGCARPKCVGYQLRRTLSTSRTISIYSSTRRRLLFPLAPPSSFYMEFWQCSLRPRKCWWPSKDALTMGSRQKALTGRKMFKSWWRGTLTEYKSLLGMQLGLGGGTVMLLAR